MSAAGEHAGLLQLLWLASPVLPVGAFSYSEGLEAAVEHGLVHSQASCATWLLNQMRLQQARSELPVVAMAHRAATQEDAQALAEANDWVLSTREASEALQQSVQMGRSLLAWFSKLPSSELELHWIEQALAAMQPGPCWPVAWGCVAAARGAALEPALHAAAFAWAENQVQAAIRSVPLGQSAGQGVLAELVAHIPEVVDQALQACQAIAFSPMLALMQSRHEQQYSRLFRS